MDTKNKLIYVNYDNSPNMLARIEIHRENPPYTLDVTTKIDICFNFLKNSPYPILCTKFPVGIQTNYVVCLIQLSSLTNIIFKKTTENKQNSIPLHVSTEIRFPPDLRASVRKDVVYKVELFRRNRGLIEKKENSNNPHCWKHVLFGTMTEAEMKIMKEKLEGAEKDQKILAIAAQGSISIFNVTR